MVGGWQGSSLCYLFGGRFSMRNSYNTTVRLGGQWVCFRSTDDWLLPTGRMGGEDCDMRL